MYVRGGVMQEVEVCGLKEDKKRGRLKESFLAHTSCAFRGGALAALRVRCGELQPSGNDNQGV